MAEAVFAARAHLTPLAPRIKIDSCGTAAYHVGETPDERTVATCRKVRFASMLNGMYGLMWGLARGAD